MTYLVLPNINYSALRVKSSSNLNQFPRYDSVKFKRLANIQSVDKIIKTSDISSIIGRDNRYPRQLNDSKRIDEVYEIQSNLNGLKKSIDDLKRKMQLKEIQTEQMRESIVQMNLAENEFNQTTEDLENRSKNLEIEFAVNKQKQNDALMTKKSYEQMLSRMKKDSIIHNLRQNSAQYILNKNSILLANLSQKSQKESEDRQKAESILQVVIEGIEQQTGNRQLNLQKFVGNLKSQQNIERKREDRAKRQQEIAEVASNDLYDGNLKKWRKLYLVHKYLNLFLRTRMQKEIKKYASVEQGFQKIKAATGIQDPNEIVQKFLGREQTYSQLLVQINQYEKKIEFYKFNNQKLKDDLNKQKNQTEPTDTEYLEQTSPIKEDKKQDKKYDKIIADIEIRANTCTLLMSRFKSWVDKNITKMARAGLLKGQDIPAYGQNKQGLQMIISILRPQLLSLTVQEQIDLISLQIMSQKEAIYESDYVRRNIRIQPSPKSEKVLITLSRGESSQNWDQISKSEELDDWEKEEIKSDGRKRK